MADIAQSHPELAKRYNQLVELCWARGWYVGITSSTRSYQEQTILYANYRAGTGNKAANPNAVIGKTPFGWNAYGSYHMIQQDGYSHALDLHWQQCTPGQFAEAARQCGLRLTVPGENWHFQWWNTAGIFDKPLPDPIVVPETPEEDEMTPVIHDPILRVGTGATPGSTPVYDFTYLPIDTNGAAANGMIVSSALYVRRSGGASLGFTVYQQGAPVRYSVPEDGTTVRVPIVAEGLISVVGDVIVEAREQWRRA
jgi:hypothetical protein